jgi:hypothetical protein
MTTDTLYADDDALILQHTKNIRFKDRRSLY